MNSKIIIQKILIFSLIAYLTLYLSQSMASKLKAPGFYSFPSDDFNVIKTLMELLIGAAGLYYTCRWVNKVSLNFTRLPLLF